MDPRYLVYFTLLAFNYVDAEQSASLESPRKPTVQIYPKIISAVVKANANITGQVYLGQNTTWSPLASQTINVPDASQNTDSYGQAPNRTYHEGRCYKLVQPIIGTYAVNVEFPCGKSLYGVNATSNRNESKLYPSEIYLPLFGLLSLSTPSMNYSIPAVSVSQSSPSVNPTDPVVLTSQLSPAVNAEAPAVSVSQSSPSVDLKAPAVSVPPLLLSSSASAIPGSELFVFLDHSTSDTVGSPPPPQTFYQLSGFYRTQLPPLTFYPSSISLTQQLPQTFPYPSVFWETQLSPQIFYQPSGSLGPQLPSQTFPQPSVSLGTQKPPQTFPQPSVPWKTQLSSQKFHQNLDFSGPLLSSFMNYQPATSKVQTSPPLTTTPQPISDSFFSKKKHLPIVSKVHTLLKNSLFKFGNILKPLSSSAGTQMHYTTYGAAADESETKEFDSKGTASPLFQGTFSWTGPFFRKKFHVSKNNIEFEKHFKLIKEP